MKNRSTNKIQRTCNKNNNNNNGNGNGNGDENYATI